jgi:primosomal protein N' (replication factor Y)
LPGRRVRVVPDVTGLDKQFDYDLPDELSDVVQIGSIVRVELHGRRVTGWVVSDDPPDDHHGRPLLPVLSFVGHGPSAEVVALGRWASWRWAASRLRPFLVAGSPRRRVRTIGRPTRHDWGTAAPHPSSPATTTLLAAGGGVLRLPPRVDVVPSVLSAIALGPALVVAPSHRDVALLATRLRRAGATVAVVPDDWHVAAAGVDVVLGTRLAAWAPCPDLAVGVVVDEHDETLQEERTPTWHARDVLAERCRRAGVPIVAISPVPTLDAVERLAPSGVVHPPHDRERRGWPTVHVVDRRDTDPWVRSLVTSPLIEVLRDRSSTVVCVSNTTGRARLLACRTCRSMIRCERCDAAVRAVDDGSLHCARCQTDRPAVCQVCGAGRFANLRPGVTRLREELAGAAARPVVAVTGRDVDVPASDVYVGTEAVLHRVHRADVVAFLEFDAEMLAPRFRAAEAALALVVRAGRIAPTVMLQTFLAEHDVVRAAVAGDPDVVLRGERSRRRSLELPPFSALARCTGSGAAEFAGALRSVEGVSAVAVLGGDRALVKATDHAALSDALGGTERPPGVRVAVDPPRA